MKLHTDTLTWQDVNQALHDAKETGDVASDTYFNLLHPCGSRTRDYGFDVKLAATDTRSARSQNSRRHTNGGRNEELALTYDEWGWFIAQIFKRDPDAVFGPYKGLDGFNNQTVYKFIIQEEVSA